ncbi:phospholipase B1, membrane-associated isoform X5 [Gasterosteus aculeatus]
MDTLEMILLFEPTTGGGSMRRGYGTTARRPSASGICEGRRHQSHRCFGGFADYGDRRQRHHRPRDPHRVPSRIVEHRRFWLISARHYFDILKLFNPHLLGAAPGKTVHGMQAHISETGFNLAVTGHNTFNLPGQTRHLIDTLRGYQGLNFEKDWKLLTILMGMNDICDYCKDKALFSVDNFIHYITISLEMLMNEVPRMIVNVVQILPMQTLREVQKPTPGCLLQRSFCSCLIEPVARSPELQELVEVNREFQRRLELLLYSDRFFRDNFAVVLQPFLEHADPPRLPNGKIDMTFFTHDCFHFTIKGHEELAKGLWNNMFQPEGRKVTVSSFSDPISLICPPKEHPYIFTRPTAARSGPPPSQGAVFLLLLLLLLLLLVFVGFC